MGYDLLILDYVNSDFSNQDLTVFELIVLDRIHALLDLLQLRMPSKFLIQDSY